MVKRKYQVVFSKAADRQLSKLAERLQQRLVRAVELLEDDPRPPGAKKLQGAENLWRVCVGEYRILYEIQKTKLVVLVIRIAHRKDIYRKGE